MTRNYSGFISYNGNRSSAGFGANTMEKCLADMVRVATYYLALGYDVKLDWLDSRCTNCNGNGTIRKQTRRMVKHIKCPICHNRDATIKLAGETPLEAAHGVEIKALF